MSNSCINFKREIAFSTGTILHTAFSPKKKKKLTVKKRAKNRFDETPSPKKHTSILTRILINAF